MTTIELVAIAGLIWFLCQHTFFRRLPKSLNYPRILMYHSVSNEKLTGMNIGPKKFEQHILLLKKWGFQFYKISEVLNLKTTKAVVITFDDGFENNYINVFPLLKKYNISATIYIAPEISDIEKLNESQISEMIASGLVEIGSHTVKHVNLTAVSYQNAEMEIQDSKKLLAQKFNIECKSFAYPFGCFNNEIAKIVQKAGYFSAVTIRKDIANLEECNPFLIPRISISGKVNKLQFAIAMLCGRYRY